MRKDQKQEASFLPPMSLKIARQEKENGKNCTREAQGGETGNNRNQWLHS